MFRLNRLGIRGKLEEQNATIIAADHCKPVSIKDSLSSLNGQSVLIVEDEPLLAFDYQDELEARGAWPTVAATLAEGLTRLAAMDANFAIIDINLGKELSWPVATALARRDIPFFVVSGRCTAEAVPAHLSPLACVSKPIGARTLVDKIERLLEAHA